MSGAGGGLGVPHLEQIWSRAIDQPVGMAQPDAALWAADQVTIYGLGVGLLETLRQLYGQRPSFAAFERWILDQNGGSIPSDRIAWVNEAVTRALSGETIVPARTIDAPPLSDEDLRFWETNGYVVLRGAVSQPASAAAAQAVWDFLGMSPDSPGDWHGESRRDGLWVPLVHHAALDANRESTRIRRAFAQLWGTEDLIATVDRSGFNPPERPTHKFRGQNLHWDTSLSLPIPLNIQGILYLTDTPAEQGAFRCVPGFHCRIEDWLASLPPGADPRAQDLSAQAVCVAAGAGDMVLWHAALPHGASPNRGVLPRLAQYISYFPPGRVDGRPWI